MNLVRSTLQTLQTLFSAFALDGEASEAAVAKRGDSKRDKRRPISSEVS
jgi:hypothetical protein